MAYDNENGPVYSMLNGKQWTPGLNGQAGISSVTISGSSNSLLNGTYTRGQDEQQYAQLDGCPGADPDNPPVPMVATYWKGSLKIYVDGGPPDWYLRDTSNYYHDMTSYLGMGVPTRNYFPFYGSLLCQSPYVDNGVGLFPGGGFEWYLPDDTLEQITFTCS
jgi:hypothetical protein